MYIVFSIPITRNKFQKPTFFYTAEKFDVGSIVFVPYPKNLKPALVTEIDTLENRKSFIRRNKIKIEKMTNETQIKLFSKKNIDFIFKAEEKTNFSIQEIWQKIIPTKITKQLNKLNPVVDVQRLQTIEKFAQTLSREYITKKLQPKQQKKIVDVGRLQSISSVISSKTAPKKSSLHSEKHYLVDEIRNYFGETASKGKGSFGFYLGFFNRVPKKVIYQYWAEVKESRKSIKDQQKLFWWKIGQYTKDRSKIKDQKSK